MSPTLGKVIDVHLHVGKTEKTERFCTLETHQKLMDKFDVEYSVVMPNVSSIIATPTLNYDMYADYLKWDTANLLPVFIIDPHDYRVIEQVEYYGSILSGLKYHPSISQECVNSAALNVYWDLAVEYDLPIIVHCGRADIANIRFLLATAKKNPKVRFVAAHMGGNATDLVELALRDIAGAKLNNLFLDTAAITLPWLIEKGCKMVGAENIMFGSDEPYASLPISLKCIELADISKEQKRSILYENAKEFFAI